MDDRIRETPNKSNMVKYKTIYADPPWSETGGGKIKRGADKHYPVMKTKDIITLMKTELEGKTEDNCHLYLWTTNSFLKDALEVIEALGFKYKTTITWVKDRIGLGQYFRGQTEHCLFAVKGCLPYKILDGKRQQGRTVIMAVRRKHSQKPDEMYNMIEKVSYAPYLEMFARNKRTGWDTFGNQLPKETQELLR